VKKKTLINFLTIFLLSIEFGMAQPSEIDHQRYWYYRHRLITDFMVPGLVDPFQYGVATGYSLPATAIGEQPNQDIRWGDATCDLGDYIAVLATEYRLLKNNGQAVDKTLQELFYAMMAYDRLDRNAENLYYPYSWDTGFPNGNLNGFFVRDDVGDLLFTQNPIFNSKYSTKGSLSYVSDYAGNHGINNGNHPGYPSPDQIAHLFMGFALVNRCLDDNETFQNYDFKYEAKHYTKKIITWIDDHNWMPLLPNLLPYNDIPSFTIFMEGNQWGIAKAAESICGELHADHMTQVLNLSMAAWNNKGDVVCPNDPTRHDGHNSVGKGIMDAIVNAGNEFTSAYIQAYAAISSSWNYGFEPACITISLPVPDICYKKILGIDTPYPCVSYINTYCCTYNFNLPANILDNINPGLFACLPEPLHLDVNITAWALDVHGENYNQQIYSLLHNYLHNEANEIGYETFANILTSAPCNLPHYKPYFDPSGTLNTSDEGASGWWTQTKWTSPSKAFHQRGDFDHGIFNGLDYMLLYNLFSLVYSTPVSYTNQMVKYISQPITAADNIESYQDLILSGTISPPTGSQLNIRAGNSVSLSPGSQITNGSNVTIQIAPYTACDVDQSRLKSSKSIEKNSIEESFEKRMANKINAYKPKIDSIRNKHAYQPLPEYIQSKSDTIVNLDLEHKVAEHINHASFQLFPVPAVDKLTLVVNLLHDDQVRVSIFDFSGRLIHKWTVSVIKGFNKSTIDISHIGNGIYSCLIETSDICEVHKITITK